MYDNSQISSTKGGLQGEGLIATNGMRKIFSKNMIRAKIIAYFTFNANWRKARTFYKDCLGGEMILQKAAESPMAAQMTSAIGLKTLHSFLINQEMAFKAADTFGVNPKEGSKTKLYPDCKSLKEIENFFSGLPLRGEIKTPFNQTFLGARQGAIID